MPCNTIPCLTSEYGVVTAVSHRAKDYGSVEEGEDWPTRARDSVERCLQTRQTHNKNNNTTVKSTIINP